MTISTRKLGVVTRGEAMTLLSGVSLGRIVFTENAMPAIRPASHLVTGGVIIARSHDGTEVVPAGDAGRSPGGEPAAGSGRETVVAYQADDIDLSSRLGWSVVVTGPATRVVDPDEIARYGAALPPWADGVEGQLIRIDPGIVSGYRLVDLGR